MKNNIQKKIYVYANWEEFEIATLIGILSAAPAKGKEVFSFAYDEEWIKKNYTQTLDPDLSFFTGPQYLNLEKSNFGFFLDSSPDRWGRILMRRREAAMARAESRTETPFIESDYLLGVFDGHRMGGIRFKLDSKGQFLNDNAKLATPAWTNLRELEFASLELERDDAASDPEYLRWLNMLLAPGSSLGGARPKASVMDSDNNLWIAKFPSRKDERDMGAWEMVAHDIAVASGVNMACGEIKKFNSTYHTYLTKRFDRNNSKRIHFASAMTMLGKTDGDDSSTGTSYLEIVDFITRNGAIPNDDLKELWRRIVLYIMIGNTDDHLRNHGFLLTEKGWKLSPAYDINPTEHPAGLKLNISESDNELNIELALSVITYFRLNKKEADEIILQITNAVKEWSNLAKKYNISKSDQELMRRSFKV